MFSMIVILQIAYVSQ